MSLTQLILHASVLCADKDRGIESVWDAVVSEIGECAEEKRIVRGFSYKEPGPDGVIGETADVMAAITDFMHVVLPNCTEDKIIDIIRPKLLKWLVNTGTVIPDNDEYFGTFIRPTFGELSHSLSTLGFTVTEEPANNEVLLPHYVLRHTNTSRPETVLMSIDEIQCAFNVISAYI